MLLFNVLRELLYEPSSDWNYASTELVHGLEVRIKLCRILLTCRSLGGNWLLSSKPWRSSS